MDQLQILQVTFVVALWSSTFGDEWRWPLGDVNGRRITSEVMILVFYMEDIPQKLAIIYFCRGQSSVPVIVTTS